MKIVGYVCYVLAAIDFITGNFLGMDLTGVFWSPIALGIVGTVFVNIGSSSEETEEDSDN